MQNNRQNNLAFVKQLMGSQEYKGLDSANKIDVLNYAVQKGANSQDVKNLMSQSHKWVRPEDIDMGGLNITELDSLTAFENQLAQHNSTMFNQLTPLLPTKVQLIVPTDAAFQQFQAESGIDLLQLGRHDSTIRKVIDCHIVNQTQPLVAGTQYKTKYGNPIAITSDNKIVTGNIQGNFLGSEALERKGNVKWMVYYTDKVLIPNDLLYILRRLGTRDPKQTYAYPLSQILIDKISPGLYNILTGSGVDAVIDPLNYQIAKGRKYDRDSLWDNSNGYRNNGGPEEEYQAEGEIYLRMVREQNNPQTAIARSIFSSPDFLKMTEASRMQFFENLLNGQRNTLDRETLTELYNKAQAYNAIDMAIKK
jgi:hypothetical protein